MLASNDELHAALRSLLSEGTYLFDGDRNIVRLGKLTFEHPTKGRRDVIADTKTLRESDTVYISAIHELLRKSLTKAGVTVSHLGHCYQYMVNFFRQPAPIVGVSGYSTPTRLLGEDADYVAEGMFLMNFYALLKEMWLPSLSIDGGVSDGCVGLNGIIAQLYSIPTLGCLPIGGLDCPGHRTRTALWGRTYIDREELVGTLADLLVCLAGDRGTREECRQNLRQGGVAVIAAPKRYESPGALPNNYLDFEEMRDAQADGRLIVHKPDNSIPETVAKAVAACKRVYRASRRTRQETLLKILKAPLY